MKVLACIPHYNHSTTITKVTHALKELGFDCLIVDDGSCSHEVQKVKALEQEGFTVFYRTQNGGKGAAMKDAIYYASHHGYTHLLQVDADAQHQLDDALNLLKMAQEDECCTVCVEPIYGLDVPADRLYGRKVTNFWMVINTLSFDIKDAMCGFRIYPVALVKKALEQYPIGNRMDFDIDILMALHRENVRFKWLQSRVKYAEDGVSHFRLFHDNLSISRTHAYWFFNMLVHFFSLIRRK